MNVNRMGSAFAISYSNWMVKSAEYFFSDTGKAQIILKDTNNVYYFGALKYFYGRGGSIVIVPG